MSEFDHVLIAKSTSRNGSGMTYHDPDPDDPDRPACRYGGREDSVWKRKDPDYLPQYEYCTYCSGDAAPSKKSGPNLADEIRRMAEREGGLDV